MAVFSLIPATLAHAEKTHTLHSVGSASVFPYAVAVAEMTSARTNSNPPVIESTGTGAGIRAFCSGPAPRFPDMAMASRPMGADEMAFCKSHGVDDFIELKIGRDGIVLASAAAKPAIRNLSLADLQQALEARGHAPRTWRDLRQDLPEHKMTFLGPPSTSGTREALTHLLGTPEHPMTIRRDGIYQEVTEQEAVVLQKLHLNPQALGVFSFGFAHLNRDRLTMVSIEGVKPNLTSIMKGTYPLSRTLYLYVKVKSIQQNQDLLEYLREFLSEAASGPQGYLTSFGFVPLRPEERQGSLESVTQASRRTP